MAGPCDFIVLRNARRLIILTVLKGVLPQLSIKIIENGVSLKKKK